MSIGIKNLQQILGAAYQVLVDSGTTTGGSNTTLEDTTKSWVANSFVHDRVEFTIATTLYRRMITSNTATELTFAALPAGVSVPAGITYEIWRYVGVSDVSDRAARLLGVIYGSQAQQLLQRAATFDLLIQLRHNGAEVDPRAIRALTSSDVVDISDKWARQLGLIDISRVLGAALSATNPVIVRLTDGTAVITSPIKTQLPDALTTAGNLKQSVEERLISKTIRDIAPGAVGTFWLPETGHIDLSKFLTSSWAIYAPTTATMVINCYLNISHDGGTTWRRAAGYSIDDTSFVRDEWNTIDCPLKLAEAKLEVVIGTAYPGELDLMCIAKA